MIYCMCTFVVAAVNFANQVYDIVEGSDLVQLILTLSNPSSYNITIQVLTTEGSATGRILTYILYKCNQNTVKLRYRHFQYLPAAKEM